MDISIIDTEGSEVHLKVQPDITIGRIIRSYRRRNGISGGVQLTYQSVPLDESMSVAEAGLRNGSQLMALITKQVAANLPTVDVCVVCAVIGARSYYKIGQSVEMTSLIEAHQERVGKKAIALKFGTYQITGVDTPTSLGLMDGDILIAY